MRVRLLAGMCAGTLLLIGTTGIATAKTNGLRIVSPRASAVFTAAHRVSISVRMPAHGGRFTATANGRSITRRFGPAHRGVRTARLVVGRDLALGRNAVAVRSGRATRTLQIIAAHRMRGLVRVQRFLRHRNGAQCLCVRATFEHGLGSPRHPLVGFEAMLNGRIVTNQFWQRAPRQRAALLGARMGLRYGRNSIVVLVFDADGHYDRVTSSIMVPRTLPLASAGFDRRVRPHQRVRLNGTGSIPARRGGRLRYRWRIVGAPRGSHPRLRGADTARPVLVPDVRGDYQVKLTVVGAKGRRATAGPGKRHQATARVAHGTSTAATTTASAPPPSGSTMPTLLPLSSTDPLSDQASTPPAALPTPVTQTPTQQNSAVVTVAASPVIPPMGCAVSTNVAPGWGVAISGTGCPRVPWSNSQIQSQGGVQLVVLDRNTLAVDEDEFFPAGGSTNWQDLSDAVAGTYPSQLVLLSGVDLRASFSQAAIDSLNYVLGQIGGTGGLNASMPALSSGAWSTIGWKGLQAGSAYQDFGQNAGANSDRGDLNGYLQSDTNNNYVFVQSQYIPFDTSASSTATSNTIQVAGRSFPSQSLPAGDSGFQLLALDAYSLGGPTLSNTFITNTPQGPSNQGIQEMAAAVGQAAANPSWLVIVQSIGSPAVSPAWVSQLTPEITHLGANWNVFNGLNGKGGYALVGGAGSDAPAAEQSAPLTGAAGQLSGILAPDDNNRFVVAQDAASDNIVTNLLPLAFSPGQPWPVPQGVTPAAAQAANHYIAQQLFHGQWPTVQDAYWQDAHGDFGGALLDQLRHDISYPTPQEDPSPGFSSTDFTAVQSELAREFDMVSDVRAMIASWQNLFTVNGPPNSVDLHNVAENVEDAINPPSSGGIAFDPMELIGALTEAASIAGETADIPGVGAMASIYRLAGSIASMTSGSGDVPVSQQIHTTADQMGWQLVTTYSVIQKSLNHVGDLLVTNYGRLAAADQHATSDWALSTANDNEISLLLKRAAEQMAYGAMVPLAWPTVYDLQTTALNKSGTPAQWYRCAGSGFGAAMQRPFRDTADDGAFMGIAGVDGNGNYLVDANVLSNIPGGAWLYDRTGQIATGLGPGFVSPPAPPEDLLSTMFNPVKDGGAGLFPQYFFAQHFTHRAVACTPTGR